MNNHPPRWAGPLISLHTLHSSMKCLSVSQPFADLIVSGRKTIDLRGWSTKHRGHILIHAPQKIRKKDCARFGITNPVTGAVLGRVTLTDVIKYESIQKVQQDAARHLAGSEFRRYGFVLESPVRFSVPVPQKGALGLFEVSLGSPSRNRMITDIIDEDCRYRWIGHH